MRDFSACTPQAPIFFHLKKEYSKMRPRHSMDAHAQEEGAVGVPDDTYSSSASGTVGSPPSKEPAPQSKYRGVCWVRANQKWKAQITIDGKQAYLGLFDSEEEAARKVDEHAAGLGRPSNFASVGKKKVASSPAAVTSPSNTAPPRDPAPQSKYRGVSWIRANQKWKAQITIDGKQTYLGLFESEVEAAFAYDEHASQMGKPVNFATQEGQKQATPSKRKRSGDLEAAPAMLVPMQPSVTAGMGAPILPTPTAPPSLMGMPVSSEYAAMPESVQMTQQSEQALAQSLAAPLVPMGIAAGEYTGGAAAAAAAEPPTVGSTHDSEVAL